FTISDWTATWQEALEQVCLTEYQKRIGSHSVQHDLSQFLKADIKTQHDIDVSDLNNGLRSFNEIRLSKGMEPVEQDWCNWFRIPQNTTYSELVAEQSFIEPETQDQNADNIPVIGAEPTQE